MKNVLLFIGGGFFSSMFFWGVYSVMKFRAGGNGEIAKDVEEQANDYYPVQSPSERAAGHPLVGTA